MEHAQSDNHSMVNDIRMNLGLNLLARSEIMDAAATEHAVYMSNNEKLSCTNKQARRIKEKIDAENVEVETDFVAINVECGESLKELQLAGVNHKPSYRNISNPRYIEMGTGIHKSSDGRLYMCQLFR